jgi:hypothetical protein
VYKVVPLSQNEYQTRRGCHLRQPHNLFSPNLGCDAFAEQVIQQLNGGFFQSEATLLGAVRGYLGKNFL